MKQLEVQIMGQSYLLSCPDGGDSRLLDAVERVDTAMCKIRDAGKVRARDRIAVLAALNLAFDLADNGVSEPQASVPVEVPQGIAPNAAQDVQAELNDPHLASLLKRMDVALGDDGRLI